MDWEATREGVDALGPVHYLINNAGLVIAESFLEMKLESIDLWEWFCLIFSGE